MLRAKSFVGRHVEDGNEWPSMKRSSVLMCVTEPAFSR